MTQDIPETRYTRSGDVHIAYQVIGPGPIDLVMVPGWVSHVEYLWEDPALARFLRRLASFSRLILFDKRGTGMSDRHAGLPDLETRMDDIRAVLDAVDSHRVTLLGVSEGGSMSVLFAATYPERTRALILYGAFAKALRSADYPWGDNQEETEASDERFFNEWGQPINLEKFAPSAANDERFRRWFGKLLRYSASPSDAVSLRQMNRLIDIRAVLPVVRVPTLVLHRGDNLIAEAGEGRFLAEHIANAKYVELPGPDHLFWIGDSDAIADEIQEFLTGERPNPAYDRVLATVLFTDIVDSTRKAVERGDRRWRDTLLEHNDLSAREIARLRGRLVATTGDGVVATFDGPARAIQCAFSIRDAILPLDLQLRAGLHTGEIEILGDNIGGIAVNFAARVLSKAGPGEVWASRTVNDLVAGSGFRFHERGLFQLKGVPGEWRLLQVEQ